MTDDLGREIEAMKAIAASLNELDEEAKARVLFWATQKYSVTRLRVFILPRRGVCLEPSQSPTPSGEEGK